MRHACVARYGVLAILVAAGAVCAAAQIPHPSAWRGVNDAGAEFNSSAQGLPGTYDKDYHYSGKETLAYFKARGFNFVRLPIRWERVQRLKSYEKGAAPELNPALDPAEVERILKYLDNAGAVGIGVVIDLHNYGKYGYAGADGKLVSALAGKDAPVGGEVFAQLWKMIASAAKDKPALWGYDLCNEPQFKSAEDWKQLTRSAVAAIRSVDAAHYILVEGIGWSHGEGWEKRHGGPWVEDPAGKVIYSAHDYLDQDNSGTYRKKFADEAKARDGKEPAARGVARVAAFGAWCREHNVPGVIGEFGVPRNDPGWLAALDAYVAKAREENLGWCYWAAGEWWGEGYPLSIQPPKAKGVPVEQWQDRPQMGVLKKYLATEEKK